MKLVDKHNCKRTKKERRICLLTPKDLISWRKYWEKCNVVPTSKCLSKNWMSREKKRHHSSFWINFTLNHNCQRKTRGYEHWSKNHDECLYNLSTMSLHGNPASGWRIWNNIQTDKSTHRAMLCLISPNSPNRHKEITASVVISQ